VKRIDQQNYCLVLGSEMSRERAILGVARATTNPVAIMIPEAPINNLRYADLVLRGNPNDPAEALEAVRRYEQKTGIAPSAVLPLTEQSLSSGFAIAQRYSLPYHSADTMDGVRNKRRMKEKFAAAGVPAPRFATFSTLEELRQQIAVFGLPVVIKPQSLSGSKGVVLIRSESDIVAAYAHLLEAVERYESEYGLCGSSLMVEQFIEAQQELSAEVLNTPTGRYVLALTDMWIGAEPYFVNTGHALPSVHSGNEKIRATALAACAALGIDMGIAVVEMKLLADGGVKLLEVGARPGGDNVMDMLERVLGVNPFELHARSYLNEDAWAFVPPAPRGRAAVAFLKAPAGVLTEVRTPTASELPESVVGLRIWCRKGDVSSPCVDSFTRDGIAEFYWPHDPASELIETHMDIARQLNERCFAVQHT
jgi:biotin carboxylase